MIIKLNSSEIGWLKTIGYDVSPDEDMTDDFQIKLVDGITAELQDLGDRERNIAEDIITKVTADW